MISIKNATDSNKLFIKKENSELTKKEIISNLKKENSFPDLTDNINYFPEINEIMTLEQKKQNFCPPSGNNFNLIIPESGVIIKDNNNNIKEGIIKENNNKFSIYQYNKIAKNILNKNEREKLIFESKLNSSCENIIMNNNNIIRDNNNTLSLINPLNENYIHGNNKSIRLNNQ